MSNLKTGDYVSINVKGRVTGMSVYGALEVETASGKKYVFAKDEVSTMIVPPPREIGFWQGRDALRGDGVYYWDGTQWRDPSGFEPIPLKFPLQDLHFIGKGRDD